MVSINTNISALSSQANLNRADKVAQSSIARLSSGQRIIRAADDAAGLAVGTGLRTDVSTLRTALTNTSQANSVLQIADGALQNIGEILQRQKALASQANSGSLSATERAFLNQEFQNLASEINRISDTTNFNGITLLDGGLYDKTTVETATNTGRAASGVITFGANIAALDTVTINGVAFTAQTIGAATTSVQFNVGLTTEDSLRNLAAALNASTNTAVSSATYTYNANQLIVTHDSAGLQGNGFTLAASAGTVSAANLTDGKEGSLTTTRTDFEGTLGDLIVTDLQGTKAVGSTTFSTATADLPADGITFIFDSGGVNTATTFTFRNATNYATNQTVADVLVGDTLQESLDNLVAKLNNFSGNATSTADDVNIFEFTRLDNTITFTAKHYGTAIGGQTFTAITTAGTIANDTPTAVTTGVARNDAANDIGGIDVANVTNNEAFVGTISGFKATYAGSADTVNIDLTVGDYTYTATSIDTTAVTSGAVNSATVRLTSGGGGYIDLVLRANQGVNVTDQASADVYASRLDAAFSGLTFYQTRDVTSYQGAGDIIVNGVKTGTLNGSSLQIRSADYSNVQAESVTVKAPVTGATDATVEVVVNGETYRSQSGIGTTIGAIVLIGVDNPNNQITFRAGSGGAGGGAIDISTDSAAQAFQEALESALGIGEGNSGLTFQVGVSSTDTIGVAIEGTGTSSLYKDADGVTQTLDVTTADNAVAAGDILDLAINRVTTLRANIGALQSRFDFAAANIQTSIQNTDAARADFLDADISAESTTFAQAQVRIQASISVLAQANQLPQSLLKLIG